jgi:hypothetical protein
MNAPFTSALDLIFKGQRYSDQQEGKSPASHPQGPRMIENQKIRPAKVIGPLGEPLTIDSLPPPDTTRWVVRRKAEVVAAVNGGLLSVDEVCERYRLTVEEFAGWQRAIDRSGMPGLRVTRIQHYRSLYERQQKY